jgi:hypothetical protein
VAEKLDLALHFEGFGNEGPDGRTSGRTRINNMELGAISRRIIAVYRDLLREKRGRGLSRLYIRQRNESKT